MNVEVMNITTKPKFSRAWGLSHTVLVINPQLRMVYVEQQYRDKSQSFRQWSGLDMSLAIPGFPSEQVCREYLEGVGQAFLQTMCDGHTVTWNGHTHIGVVNDAAYEASFRLEDDLQSLPEKYRFWETEEWLARFRIGKSDDIKALSRELEAYAQHENIVLDKPVLQYLQHLAPS